MLTVARSHRSQFVLFIRRITAENDFRGQAVLLSKNKREAMRWRAANSLLMPMTVWSEHCGAHFYLIVIGGSPPLAGLQSACQLSASGKQLKNRVATHMVHRVQGEGVKAVIETLTVSKVPSRIDFILSLLNPGL